VVRDKSSYQQTAPLAQGDNTKTRTIIQIQHVKTAQMANMQHNRQQEGAKIVLLEDGTMETLPHMIPPMTAHANSAEKERMHQINLAQEEVARTALMASTNPTTLLLNINVRPVAKDKLPPTRRQPSVMHALAERINH
jgi:hypothetical protein